MQSLTVLKCYNSENIAQNNFTYLYITLNVSDFMMKKAGTAVTCD